GGNDEIGIILIETQDMLRLDHLTSAQVVGNIQQTADKHRVARNAFLLYLVAGRAGGNLFTDKAALGSVGDDNGVLYLLCFYQSQHLRVVIRQSIGPRSEERRVGKERRPHW